MTLFAVVTRLLSFLFKIWMSRTLGAEAVGLYQIAFSVLLLLFALTAGAPTVLSRKVAECAARGDTRRQNALTTASILIGLVTSATICALFLALSGHLDIVFTDSRCVPIFLIMLPALVTSSKSMMVVASAPFSGTAVIASLRVRYFTPSISAAKEP